MTQKNIFSGLRVTQVIDVVSQHTGTECPNRVATLFPLPLVCGAFCEIAKVGLR